MAFIDLAGEQVTLEVWPALRDLMYQHHMLGYPFATHILARHRNQ